MHAKIIICQFGIVNIDARTTVDMWDMPGSFQLEAKLFLSVDNQYRHNKQMPDHTNICSASTRMIFK